eukprot:9260816-Alexandrium_andersonii.AAC.1
MATFLAKARPLDHAEALVGPNGEVTHGRGILHLSRAVAIKQVELQLAGVVIVGGGDLEEVNNRATLDGH